MRPFQLDAQLVADCHVLGKLPFSHVLLHRNAEVPWFILVPETSVVELIDLTIAQQQQLLGEVKSVTRFLRDFFTIEKMNIAALGNVVSQLHVHVVGRRRDDACWPAPVWGNLHTQSEYLEQALSDIATGLVGHGVLPGK